MKPMSPLSPRAALAAGGLLFAVLSGFASAATFTVTNTNDAGAGSLRQAIADANAAVGDDTIDFDGGLDGAVITLSNGQLTVTSDIAFDASALPAGITVSGNDASRILAITPGFHVVSLTHITLRNGFAGNNTNGGAILLESGDLTLTDCTLRQNLAEDDGGAVYADGILTITNSTISGNEAFGAGGGVVVAPFGEATISNSSILDNRALLGGGLYTEDQAVSTLTNVTVAGNFVYWDGGGLYVLLDGAMITINCTVSGNTADYGGGIYYRHSGSLEIENTIVAGNTAAVESPDIHERLIYNINVTERGRNIIGDSGAANSNFTEDGVFIGGDAFPPVDPVLAPLGDYGGPTLTMPPVPGSPAIDEAITEPSTPATDQRGTARPLDGDGHSGADPDIGAVELDPAPPPFYVPADGATGVGIEPTFYWSFEPGADSYDIYLGTTSGALSSIGSSTLGRFTPAPLDFLTTYYWRVDAVTGGSTTPGPELSFTTRATLTVDTHVDENDGIGVNRVSLREAIEAGDSLPGPTLIRFAPALDGRTIVLTEGLIQIDSEIEIDASSLAAGVTVSGGGASRIFDIRPSADVTLRKLTLRDGFADTGGGGAIISGTALLEEVRVLDCRATFSGGGLVVGGTAVIRNSTIARNHGPTDAGGIEVGGSGTLTLINSTVSENSTQGDGGGIELNVSFTRNVNALATFIHSTIVDNIAEGEGGGIYVIANGALHLENTIVAANSNGDIERQSSNIQSGDYPISTFFTPVITVAGANLIGNNSSVSTIFPEDFVLVGDNISPVDPRVAPLANYGGCTDTRGLLPDSPAIDAAIGTAQSPTADQRGAVRPVDGDDVGPVSADIGAFEFDPAIPFFYPLDGQAGVSTRATVIWTFGPFADSYDIYLGTTPGALSLVGSTTDYLLELPELLPGTTYYWQVVAHFGPGNLTSPELSFTTRPAILVDTNVDEDDGIDTGNVSLRDAIAAAEDEPGYDLIHFHTSLNNQTITLTHGELRIESDLAIDAAAVGGPVTVSGDNLSRVFQVSFASTSFEGITIADGVADYGGGVEVIGDGSADFTQAVFVNNRATNCGGGFAARDDTTVSFTDSVFSDNTSDSSGGAICVLIDGTATFTNTTISSNEARFGGGFYIGQDGQVQLVNVTVAANTAEYGGGIYYTSNTSGGLEFENSIVASNFAEATGPDIWRWVGSPAIVSTGVNVVGDNDTAAADLPEDGIFIGGTTLPPVVAGLAPLADYGGPTQTHSLLPGSPALDTGITTASTPTRDQRGTSRPLDGDGDTTATVDLGAFELNPADPSFFFPADGAVEVPLPPVLYWSSSPFADSYDVYLGTSPGSLALVATTTIGTYELPLLDFGTTYYWRIDPTTGGSTTTGTVYSFTTRAPIVVNTLVDENDGIAVNDISLRDAAAAAKAIKGPDKILFDLSLDGGTIDLTNGEITLDSNLTIDAGALSGGLTVSGNHTTRVFVVGELATVSIRSLTITQGTAAQGGGIFTDGERALTLDDCTFTDNVASSVGAALFVGGNATVIATSSRFIDNHASSSGGAAYVASQGNVTLVSSTISDNFGSSGGAFGVTNDAVVSIEDSTISENVATFQGGGFYLADNASLELTNCTLSGNSGFNYGGGITNDGAGATVTLAHTTVAGNSSIAGGGIALRRSGATLHTENSIIAANAANSEGPDVHIGPFGITITPAGANLIGDNETVSATFPEDGILIGGSTLPPVDPLLAPLGPYGGPTDTRPLLPGSPAIDAAIPGGSPPAADQRGTSRPLDGEGDSTASYDLGAFELDPLDPPFFIPADGTTDVIVRPLLQWSFEPFADSYEVYLGTVPNFMPLVTATTAGAHAPARLHPGTTYFWRIDALFGATRISSAELSFTTRPAIVVDTLVDENDGAGTNDVSLRDALAAADADPGLDLIQFHSSLDGLTIALTLGPLTVDSEVEVDASARAGGITVSGGNTSGVFSVTRNGRLTVDTLAILDGNASGINIMTDGSATVRNSTISRNTATSGGALFVGFNATATVVNSTLSGNVATSRGGGVYLSNDGVLNLINSTITENSSWTDGGGIQLSSFDSLLQIENSIVAGNFASDLGPDIRKANGATPINVSGINLIGDNATADANFPEDGILVGGTTLPPVDPVLAPLSDAGGPTPTHALLPGSPALDAGIPAASTPADDQRGTARPLDGDGDAIPALDLGAFEFNFADPPLFLPPDLATEVSLQPDLAWTFEPFADSYNVFFMIPGPLILTLGTSDGRLTAPLLLPETTYYWQVQAITGGEESYSPWFSFTTRPALLVDTVVDENDGVSVNDVSLRDAITAAEANPGYDSIRFDPSLASQTIVLSSSGQLNIRSDLRIDASDLAGNIEVSGNTPGRVFYITSDANATLSGLDIADARFGAVTVAKFANASLRDMTFENNRGSSSGAGLTVDDNATADLAGVTFTGGIASSRGGAVLLWDNASATLVNCTMTGNYASSSGGGLHVDDAAAAHLIHCTIAGNNTGGGGGGISGDSFGTASLVLENSIVASNTSAGAGPDIQHFAGLSAAGVNLIGDNLSVETLFPADGILVGTGASPVDPLLAPLADYGGRAPTLFPLPGSPAVDAAILTVDTPITDQRGAPRVTDAAPDLGTVEQYFIAAPPLVDTDNDGMDDNLEPLYGFVVGILDGHLDSDGDNSSNAAELGNRTDPHDSSDYFRILSLTPAAGFDPMTNPVFDITWSTFPGLSYMLECDQGLDFSAPGTLGPYTSDSFTETVTITLFPGIDFVRIQRD